MVLGRLYNEETIRSLIDIVLTSHGCHVYDKDKIKFAIIQSDILYSKYFLFNTLNAAKEWHNGHPFSYVVIYEIDNDNIMWLMGVDDGDEVNSHYFGEVYNKSDSDTALHYYDIDDVDKLLRMGKLISKI